MVTFLTESGLPFAIALTKADKLSRQKSLSQAAAIKRQLKLPKGTPMIVTSSSEGTGIDELRKLIRQHVEEVEAE